MSICVDRDLVLLQHAREIRLQHAGLVPIDRGKFVVLGASGERLFDFRRNIAAMGLIGGCGSGRQRPGL
jgi:hypothetical protein